MSRSSKEGGFFFKDSFLHSGVFFRRRWFDSGKKRLYLDFDPLARPQQIYFQRHSNGVLHEIVFIFSYIEETMVLVFASESGDNQSTIQPESELFLVK